MNKIRPFLIGAGLGVACGCIILGFFALVVRVWHASPQTIAILIGFMICGAVIGYLCR
ncbi:MAG: hypothetical protein MN733_23860 [Nitrososphaera sp.]|nr:hypothetical protein [Nitrososphaera sp.]